MVSLFFFLSLIYYSSLFALFAVFYAFKVTFHISSNSPKIIYQSLTRHFPAKYIMYGIILQFIGIVPSVVFYIKYCFLVNAPYIKYFYGLVFLFLNLLVSVFFYFQFFKKWNVVTAEEYRQISMYRKIKYSDDFERYFYFTHDWKRRYNIVYWLIIYITWNIVAPIYFQDFFQILYAVIV